MRGLAVAAMCAGALVACGGVEPARRIPQDFRRLEADFALAWEVAVRVLIERGFDIRTTDRDAGIIETGWLSINPKFVATIFMTDQEDRYSTCGRPGLFRAYRGKEARLVLILRAMPRAEAGLRAEGHFRTQRYSHVPLWPNGPLGDEECSSRGRLEEEIRLQIQLRALTDQLNRLRRGAH